MKESRDLSGVFQDWVTRSAAEQARAAQRYGELLTRLGRGDLFQPAVRDAYWRFVQEESGRYLQSLANLSLDYYRALFDLARASSDRFFADVMGSGPGHVTAEPVPDSPRRVELHMRAPAGGVATGSFILQNKRATDAEVSFLASEFIGPGGIAQSVAGLEFDPARFILRPGEDRLVVVRLPLSSDLFSPGERYTCTVVVQGYNELALGLEVLVSGPGDPAAAARASISPSARGRGRRRSHD